MQSIVTYLRSLLGGSDNVFSDMQRLKRGRADEGFSTEDDSPALKRPKLLIKPVFPATMSTNRNTNGWQTGKIESNVRYVPIEVESGNPCTSIPMEPVDNDGAQAWTVPMQLVELEDDDTYKMRLVAVEQKNDVDNPYLTDDEDDVIFVHHQPTYYKLSRRPTDKVTMSRHSYSKIIGPRAISKSYKQAIPISRWLQGPKQMNLSKNMYLCRNGSTRSKLNEVFNFEENKNYQELIKKVSECMKPASFGKPLHILNIGEEIASFRNTLKTQKKSLDGIISVDKDICAEKENSLSTEYDPQPVSSLKSVNSLKASYLDKAITSGDWVSNIDTKYRRLKLVRQEKVTDYRLESDIAIKVNRGQRIAQLEHRLKYELTIPESLLKEPLQPKPTPELPAFTPEQEKLVNRALGPGPPGQLLVEKFNLKIHRRDLQTLAGLNWLNDEVINFYMNLLMQRSQDKKNLPKVYATNTFFYPKLMQSGQTGLRRWTRKVDIFAHDLMVVPVHLGVHWCISIVDFREKRINYLDSMGNRNQACLAALMKYLRDEHQDKKGAPFDNAGWTTECLKDIPQQTNSSDCGIFSCTFAEFSARDAPYSFTPAQMPYLRHKAALEILTGSLLL